MPILCIACAGRFRTIVYPVVGLAIVGGFYLLFREVLQVPLPVGSVFAG